MADRQAVRSAIGNRQKNDLRHSDDLAASLEASAATTKGRRGIFILILLLTLSFNSVDRLALYIVLPAIKADLRLTDTELGILTGTAFAIFYGIAGLPIARLADRTNRVTLMSTLTGCVGLAVMLCGLASSFLQLLLIRAGVAIGEAGTMPTAHSLIADYYTRAERPRAASIYALGVPISAIIGFYGAGWLSEQYGWRTTFLILGAPSLLIAFATRFYLFEPRVHRPGAQAAAAGCGTPKEAADADRTVDGAMASAWTSMRHLVSNNPTFRYLILGFVAASFVANAINIWLPSFLIRSFAISASNAGIWLMLIYGVGGLLGTFLGGGLATRLAAAGERRQLRFMGLAYIIVGVSSTLAYLQAGLIWAIFFLVISNIGFCMVAGPLMSTAQSIVPSNARAFSIALLLLAGSLVGLGLGPLLSGFISDALSARWGVQSLRYTLLVICPGHAVAALFFWHASHTAAADADSAARVEVDTTRESDEMGDVAVEAHNTTAIS